MDQLLNQPLGNYQIEELLGEGAMGAVYKARHSTLQNEVAVKVMHAQYARRTIFQERFLQEARIAANLNHPGIVRVSDFGEARGYLFIVMEYISGGNLQEFLQNLQEQDQWIRLSEAVQLLRRVALALDHAHRHGIYHRDIKPANIMVKLSVEESERYFPVITDLGLAKLVEGGVDTASNATMGTPAYMSPEQAKGEEVDARSDVYSLGILLYELTVGRRPFPIRTLTEALRYHTREAPPAPRSVNPQIPPILEQIILKAIEKRPVRRFQSARALAQSLTSAVPSELGNTLPPTAPNGASSLYTQMQESLIEHRGSSLIQEFPETISPLASGGAHIQIMKPEGDALTVPMNKSTLIIGRGAEADIILEDPKISRQHVVIQAMGGRCLVNDLGTTNGTYLGNNRLQAGQPAEWSPERPLRLGSHNLRLIPAAQIIIEKSDVDAESPSRQQTLQTTAYDVQSSPRLSQQDQTQPYRDVGSIVPQRPQPQKATSQEVAADQKSSTRRIFTWASPLLLLMLTGFGAYFYQYSNMFGPTVPTPIPTAVVDTPMPTIDPDDVALLDTPSPINTATALPVPTLLDTATEPSVVLSNTQTPSETFTSVPPSTDTPLPAIPTSVPPTNTSVPPSPIPETSTPIPSETFIPVPTGTATPLPPTSTSAPPTNTSLPPSPTPAPDFESSGRFNDLVIDATFVRIESGNFVYGSTQAEIDKGLSICRQYSGEKCHPRDFENETFSDNTDLFGGARSIPMSELWIMETEVTNSQFDACIVGGRCRTPPDSSRTQGPPDHPVRLLESADAETFARWACGRLPTELEWEKAARGVDGRIYPWGNEWSAQSANSCGGECDKSTETGINRPNDGYAATAPVTSFANGRSPYGLYHMVGNVREWVTTVWEHQGMDRPFMLKGGSFYDFPDVMRTAERLRWPKDDDGTITAGFRIVRTRVDGCSFN